VRAPRFGRSAADGLSLVVAVVALTGLQAEPDAILSGALDAGPIEAAIAYLALREFDGSSGGGTTPLRAQLLSVLNVASVVSVTIGALSLAFVDGDAANREVLQTWLALVACLGVGRLLLHALRGRRGTGARTAVIVGAGAVGRRVAERLQAGYGPGLRPIGFIDDAPLPDDETKGREAGSLPPLLGGIGELDEVIERHRPECVVIASPPADDEHLVEYVRRCWSRDLEVVLVPRLYALQAHRSDLYHLGSVPLQRLVRPRRRRWAMRAKLALDRLLAAGALVALAPLLLLIAAAVRLAAGSPVLFRQTRVGRGGRHFDMLKFRTMRLSPDVVGEADAAWAASVVPAATASAPVVATPLAERRCTAVTEFLRRYSLDELPQIINILRGEMSWIGPRPERVHYVEVFEREVMGYADRHRMHMGLTGWAQVHGLRGETSLHDRVEWDNAYIDNWSPWLDVEILCRTLPAAVRTPGCAYRERKKTRAAERRHPVAVVADPSATGSSD
jgi:exopolysaccharide biosynthesis polyprenyl glycosylphosphotransferase